MSRSTPLAVGDQVAGDASAPLVYPDDTVEERTVASCVEERPTLFVFYTNDFSPDCVTEWCSFRDYTWFSAADRVNIVGVSASRVGTHKRFIDYLGLDFPLFADEDLEITEAFGVRYKAFKLFTRSKRSVFLVDGDRTVRYRWVGESLVDPTRDQPPLEEIRHAVEDATGGTDDAFGFA
ncbi:redoxin domain-containing protein [Halocalculus aciditolerans]|uniref:thioredoxin-dependent peroxiredoxin n=1 Tax=Halocalculus aciditolerans TaxID=1383812 RepID=A0A830F817_9EURY|nr:redoxin domain-containing protein [Halocalculus aciditolerans]GGL63803.1 peroxiredoxin [Halocalculus aciditolerans]